MEWQHLRPARARAARLVFLTCALAALVLSAPPAQRLAPGASAQGERFEGQWLVEYRTREGKTSLTLRYRGGRRGAEDRRHEGYGDTTRNVAPESLRGLTPGQADSASGTNVRFDVPREAGTFACEGWFRQGSGSGHFNFVPDPGFAAELSRRGVGTPDTWQLFRLALADVGLALLDELKSAGYEQPTLDQLVRMGDHGVRVDYVRGLRELGYRLGTVESLVRMRDHGVSLEYIAELRDAGFGDLAAEALVRTRDHGVTSDFVKAMRAEGYDALSLEQLVKARDHGVTVGFIRELHDLGYTRLPVESLIRLRDHGVSIDFVRRAKSGGSAPTVEELIRMKDRGSY